MPARLRPRDESRPFPNQGLSLLVCRMRLAGDDELRRALRIGQDAQQPIRVMEQQRRSSSGQRGKRG